MKYNDGEWPCALQNWNYNSSMRQWVLTPYPRTRNTVWSVSRKENNDNFDQYNDNLIVRPAFYLKADTILSGTGTQADPYEIENT